MVDMRAQQMRVTQRGFTLFELIVVICVVMLVIYVGLPRFEKTLQASHKLAVTLGARALRDGVERARAIQMLDGLSGSTYNLPRFGDGTLDLSTAGYPAGTTRQPGDRLRAENCAEIWNALLESNPDDSHKTADINYRVGIDTHGKTPVCVYSYVHGGAMSISYDPMSGKVWADTQFKGSAFSN